LIDAEKISTKLSLLKEAFLFFVNGRDRRETIPNTVKNPPRVVATDVKRLVA
jgi:hypothetical protein